MSAETGSIVRLRFEAGIIYWRGPSPFFFTPIPPDCVPELKYAARLVTYGWGMVPVEATIADVTFRTSLYPKDGAYLLPLKAAVRRRANITAGDAIVVELSIQPPRE